MAMKNIFALLLITFGALTGSAQNVMTPEILWSLGRVSGLGVTPDGQSVIYNVSTPNVASNKSSSKLYSIPIAGGAAKEISTNPLPDKNVSPDGKYMRSHKEVKVMKITGQDKYPDLTKSNAYVFDDIAIRHWDTWEEGAFDHVFLTELVYGEPGKETDVMAGQPYDCPQKPFGGDEDYVWNPDKTSFVYVTKQKFGKDYAVSTNTDIFRYDLATNTTKNLTEGRMGYDINPAFNSSGVMAFLSMRRDGYESDKQDLIVKLSNNFHNITGDRDDLHVEGFVWGKDGRLYFWAPVNGTQQLFAVEQFNPDTYKEEIRQITKGDFDITGIVGQSGNTLVVSRTDMNHAAELYTVNLNDGSMKQLTHVNDDIYKNISMVKTERRWVKTTDHKDMLVWMIYPPDFDPTKKYPTLLYCQGGPQSALTQFYSFRWNFQLMASQGYIVVAPNRRGMPGHGTEWNEEISKDHGGQVMKDYLSETEV